MPVPFDDLSAESTHSGGIAWLRFLDEEDGEGVRAALFQTSDQGEPLDFCFSRIDRRQSLGQGGTARPGALSSLAKSLFQAATSSPILILGLADEVPPSAFTDDIRLRIPFCRIKTAGALTHAGFEYGGPYNEHFELLWATQHPHVGSGACQLLDEILERNDPLEPFERAAEGLAEAFGDGRVQAMAAIPGLVTVVRLSSLPERPEYAVNRSSATHEPVREPNPVPQSSLTLAERLWAILASPRENAQVTQLEWPGELMPFQQDGVRALLNNHQLLLADDMGLGKTLQAIAALRILRARREIKSCLVAAPASLLDQWRREINKWAPELSAIIIRGSATDRMWQWEAQTDMTLVSYDTLRSDFGDNVHSAVRRKTWDVVVADEAQRIKNRNDTSDALKGLQRTRSWALTGTPIENHEEELASILEFVDYDGSEVPKRYRPGVELLARHRELQLRRKKSEVLDDLPPKQVTKVTIDLNSKQRNSYDKAEQEGVVYLKSLGAEVGVQHVLELITRLKQICNADPKTGESSKLDDIKDRLTQLGAQGHKALVFSQYTTDTAGVAAAATHLQDFNPLTITGDIPPQERTEIIERFKTQTQNQVLIISLRAGGLGLNLQEASYVFHLDRWWNPAVERQAEDRSHRIGQLVKVNVIKYSCAGTIEERIDQILARKQDLFDQLIDDVSLDLSTEMSREELFGLFGLGLVRES